MSDAAAGWIPVNCGHDIHPRTDVGSSPALLAFSAGIVQNGYIAGTTQRGNAMDQTILDSASDDRRYECFGSNECSCIFDCGRREARFWLSLGYVVLHFASQADRATTSPTGENSCASS